MCYSIFELSLRTLNLKFIYEWNYRKLTKIWEEMSELGIAVVDVIVK